MDKLIGLPRRITNRSYTLTRSSTEGAAQGCIKQDGLSVEPEEVAMDMVEHTLPGVIIVPSLAAALASFQCEGHYSYMAA